MIFSDQVKGAIENIYISPLEGCNLNCKYCYTNKTKNALSNKQILDFVKKYDDVLISDKQKLKSILFCGGEVFILPKFSELVNELIEKDIFITIITNGTVDKLSEIKDPSNCQIIVSFDGPKEIHDKNRGLGNFEKSINFVQHALSLGFPVELFFLITKDSYEYKDSFDVLGLPKTYLTDRRLSLSPAQALDIKKNYRTFPDKNFGCFQISLQSDCNITGCCESNKSLGTITDDPYLFISNFVKSLNLCSNCSLSNKCHGCCEKDYLCGYKKELSLDSCLDVVKSFD